MGSGEPSAGVGGGGSLQGALPSAQSTGLGVHPLYPLPQQRLLPPLQRWGAPMEHLRMLEAWGRSHGSPPARSANQIPTQTYPQSRNLESEEGRTSRGEQGPT